jgi:lysophospholipase L1-like esterase
MKVILVAVVSFLLPQSVMAIALHHQEYQKPPIFVLTGDSTVAADGGWGNGFLADTKEPATGINLAKQGATTASFKSEGLWDQALNSVRNNTECASPIVTIQFGHNDQKEAHNISPERFKSNLEKMANEVSEAGGTPVRTLVRVA